MVEDAKNYYLLELGSECKLAKVVNDERSMLKKNPDC